MASGQPSSLLDFQSHAARLSDPALDIKSKLAVANELRDSVEIYRDNDPARFTSAILPVLVQVLRTTQPVFRRDLPEQLFRHAILATLHRLPHNESIRPSAVDVMNLMVDTLRTDNEENGSMCVKIVIDLNRSYRSTLEGHVQPFIDFVQDMYNSTDTLVKETFGEDAPIPTGSEADDKDKTLARAIQSFKVLSECPIASVTFFQHYRQLVPPTIKFLCTQAEPQQRAHEEASARNNMWIGVSRGIKNRAAYTDFITAQVKTMSFLAYVFRGAIDVVREYQDVVPQASIRLLQDCPSEAAGIRKELLVAIRHVLNTEFRTQYLSQVDHLLDERVLIGVGAASQEGLRPLAYSVLADLIHHIRNDLSQAQLIRIIHTYSCNLHTTSLSGGIQTMCTKLLVTLVDCVVAKCSPAEAVPILNSLLQTMVEKLDVIHRICSDIQIVADDSKPEKEIVTSFIRVEKAKPVQGMSFASENPEDALREGRVLFRTLLHGFRAVMSSIRTAQGAPPDGDIMCRLFESGVRCLRLFDNRPGDPRDEKEAIEWFGFVIQEMEPHVFQEVWTLKMDFFIESVLVHPLVIALPQILLSSELVSHQLVSIMLHHLVAKLDRLGEQDVKHASATLRLFKMCFMAVTVLPELNEPALVPHLPKLIVESFPLAARAKEPTNYFLLLRALFRAIGGGKFEALYKEVLPLLQEMLENLNRLLLSAEPSKRDLLVELCLTVPVRLTHLLPYLSYLMQPLVFALRAGPELVAQGLRTLELCIDNLTQEFLDPMLSPVLRELMDALHSHLKPQPGNHQHAHTTVRILGKLGGRNRRLQHQHPHLQYRHYADEANMLVSFDGHRARIDLGPMIALARRSLRHPVVFYRSYAYDVLKQSVVIFLHEGVKGREREAVFTTAVEGLMDAIHIVEFKAQASEYLRDLSRHIFLAELSREITPSTSRRFPLSPLFVIFLDALPQGLAYADPQEISNGKELITSIVSQMMILGAEGTTENGSKLNDPSIIYHNLASRFIAMCFKEAVTKKIAGFNGIYILTNTPDLREKWIHDRQLDFVRALLSVLKDMPNDPPRHADDILNALKHILRICNTPRPPTEQGTPLPPNPSRTLPYLIGILVSELASSNAIVRNATQACIELVAELSGKPVTEMLAPHRDRLLGPIFGKPLRALPFSNQIGNIDAVTYTLNLRPPLPDLNEELLRMLHETLALADAEDQALIGRGAQRQTNVALIKLRVACIRLLTASMPVSDFFSKQGQMRQRVTGVYFKSLYSLSSDVKHAAHEGLRVALTHQSRLPKDLLQTGLRPILMNLADPKRLSVPNLEGLARLLELLTNYFKVEIGLKLLEHFRSLADTTMLQDAAFTPLAENDEIAKLVRLVHIFHLLPSPAARIFLIDLVSVVVQTETQLFAAAPSPFTEPLSKYLDCYPTEAVEFFFENLNQPRHVRTLRSVLQSNLAPSMSKEILTRIPPLIVSCFRDETRALVTPCLFICLDLVALNPDWIRERGDVVDALLELWRSDFTNLDEAGYPPPGTRPHQLSTIVQIFMKCLEQDVEQTKKLDILFGMVTVYTHRTPMDLTPLTRLLHRQVAMNESVGFKREVLRRFLQWFEDPACTWAHKTQLLRMVINPMLLVSLSSSERKEELVDADTLNGIHVKIWRPMVNVAGDVFPGSDDALKIELMHMSCILVQYRSDLMQDARKDVIKFAWLYIVSEDAIVKQTAYILIARFFDAFDSPVKLILRVWTGLLRPASHAEGRNLIRQAIDILAPALPKRIPPESGPPPWAKLTRRILIDEGHGISQLVVIYQVIMRHSDLFYSCRELFVSHMVHSLIKLGLPPSSSIETRLMTLDILDLILTWERRKAKEMEDAMDVSPAEASAALPAASGSSGWVMPLSLRESCVSYLVRFVVMTPSDSNKPPVVARALEILKSLLKLPGWGEVAIKLAFFTRTLIQTEISEQTLPTLANSAKLLFIVVADKPDAWYITNAGQLQKLLEKGMSGNEPVLHESLQPIFDRLLAALPQPVEDEEAQGDVHAFYTFVETTITEGLRSATGLHGTLSMLRAYVKVRPQMLEPFAGNLMKIFSKLCKDHILAITSKAPGDGTSRLIKLVLAISQAQVPSSQEARRWLITGLLQLVDKSTDTSLCRLILDMSREWVFQRKDGVPAMKEKASLLLKMTSFEFKRGDDALFADYLQLIFDIYTEPSLRRTDLTTRLEPAFLLGCRIKDPKIRARFTDLFEESLPRSLMSRLQYVLGSQSWEYLADHNWVPQALDLLLGCARGGDSLVHPSASTPTPSDFLRATLQSKVLDIIRPIRMLLHLDSNATHLTWVSVFKAIWSSLSRKEQTEVSRSMVALLGKEYHSKQIDMPHNVIQSLLAGVLACSPPMTLPPYVVKYLGKTYNAWHIALEILQGSVDHIKDDTNILDNTRDALAELYAELAEEDMFYGLWRRRSLYPETNAALSFEQNGMWPQAQTMYEAAQIKARTGVVPFSESEYCLWEDHWILSAQKLQQWDVLTDFARNEGNHDLLLECAWRLSDWSADQETIDRTLESVSEVATPRRRVFEAYTALVKAQQGAEKTEFIRILEEAIQLSLRKWVSLPTIVSMAHVPLLQHFQQFVELQEAAQIFAALAQTTRQNLEKRSSDLKVVLQAWRERLPNLWDDISLWSDLVAWRQHVFNAINKAYLPLIPNPAANGGSGTGSTNTYGYRGYHETAWIINRFAHVARKHQLQEVCHNALTKIYTLPNIEISEAFLKLREQARCHYLNPNELPAGLEVINNTNLMYFSNAQKAEFYTLKGMFFAKLGRNEDANAAFGQAVQMDLGMPKSWAEWGRYNDRIFKDSPTDMPHAANAVSCYLQAIGIYKSAKSRPLLIRVMWLLSLDDSAGTVSRAFEAYKGELALWYWITLIPQLLLSLSHREARHARQMLINLAKVYPQALFFLLRTTKEDYAVVRRQAAARAGATAVNDESNPSTPANPSGGASGTLPSSTPADHTPGSQQGPMPTGDGVPRNRQPWEHVDEIVAILKTAFPLLALTMETMVDQIGTRLKPSSEEELYRFIGILLAEGLQYLTRGATQENNDGSVPPVCFNNITRVAASLPEPTRSAFEDDIVRSNPTLKQYVHKLQQWRDRHENILDSRPRFQSLDILSHWLVEFQHSKFDDIEVPGQYLEHKDGASNFVRITRFDSQFEVCRGNGFCFRRIVMAGHDGTKHSFAVQLPVARHCRREERIMQLFRIFNSVLSRRKESRKRNLAFYLPPAIPLSPQLRLLENDLSFVTLQDIHDQHCSDMGISKEEPITMFADKMRTIMDLRKRLTPVEMVNVKMELADEISTKLVPNNVLTNYMLRSMAGPIELWIMRKQIALQLSAITFMSYVMTGSSRIPSRFHVSRATGLIYMSELLPSFSNNIPIFASPDAVPFRFTPNMQHFLTPIGIEGLLTSGIMSIGRCLTEPEFDLDQQLSLFIRDEVLTWYNSHQKQQTNDLVFRDHIAQNVEAIVKKAEILSCRLERDMGNANSPMTAVQSITNLISEATNPQNLAKMGEAWYPWF
ncbi:hypothetical protein BOTBODRAFT_142417 [Botryobasidium botryosum FD-172 SS1]|uniref:Non-specific serine/threonine protein kinase n=1 Tax=Botryobasidium botryosum (strain FD-172 SS1) TaxID=930990 RepID=A0A067NBA8_BOTB1|nr:hypothetical protein BOTBODRAFT_142417 [Botryobasidium botryosum FD-172 SS1]